VDLIDKGEKPTALLMEGGLKIQPILHNELVTIDCEFLAVREGSQETILQCRSGDTYFEAWLPKFDPILNEVKPRDTLRLTGVYEVTTTHPIPRIEWANGFKLNLAGPDAISILKRAPWWTFDRLMATLGIAIAAILAFLVWTSLLRRRVAAQTKIISSQIERATIKDERQRIARELHDTLEQDLTGLSMQLENAIEEIGNETSSVHQSLSLVHRMLRRCRIEARASVSDLRDTNLAETPLPEAIEKSLRSKARDTNTTLDFSLEGSPQNLPSTTRHQLLRIAGEAMNNAQRHGGATRIHCRLAYTKDRVVLEIEDNGCGFDATQPVPPGHFGLTGMRERANKIHAGFSLISNPGNGTKIRIDLPYASPETRPPSLAPE
jgi:signal transduction histidine kinase